MTISIFNAFLRILISRSAASKSKWTRDKRPDAPGVAFCSDAITTRSGWLPIARLQTAYKADPPHPS